MGTEIINIDETLEKAKQTLDYCYKKLDLKQSDLTIIDHENKVHTNAYEKTMENLYMLAGGSRLDKFTGIVCKNLFKIQADTNIRLVIISKNIKNQVIEIIDAIDKLNTANGQYQEQISILEKENETLNIRLDTLKEDKYSSELNYLKEEIRMLKYGKMGLNNIDDEENPDSYFDKTPTRPVFDEVEEDDTEIIFKKNQQKAHTEMLDIIKADNLYPMHKIDTEESKSIYISNWGYIAPRYELEDDDYPKMIDKLDSYKNKPDDYLDEVRE